MKRIPLSQGKFTIVDDWNYERLSKYKWYAAKRKYTYYAARNSRRRESSKQKVIFMHHQVISVPDGKFADHRNQNGWDNREHNLRVCTKSQNSQNMKFIKGISEYKGVSWRKDRDKWRAYIVVNQKQISLGHFDSEVEAAKAYDKKALELFGEYACTNFPRKEYIDAA